jgi:hypothetical protein
MSLPPTIYTSPAGMDGTVTGMIVTAVVAALALVMLIGLIYRASSHPDVRPRAMRSPGTAPRAVPPAEPRSGLAGPGAPDYLPTGGTHDSPTRV